MRIIVAGGRRFDDYELLKDSLDSYINKERSKGYTGNIEIVSGRAIGTDRLGERYAEEHKLDCAKFEAEWFKLGRRAGIVRNGQMADYAAKDSDNRGVLFAFWNGSSKGTKNMIDQAEEHKLEIHIVRYDE